MKLSIEINEQAKKLLLELLQDPDVIKEIYGIAWPAGQCAAMDNQMKDLVDEKIQDLINEDQCQEIIEENLKQSIFSVTYEG